MLWSPEHLASPSASPDSARDWTTRVATWPSSFLDLLIGYGPAGWSGRTSMESVAAADGRDFGSFLGALGQLGYGWAYRVLDAQYGGVPQRRRRVFVVGHLGDWRRAAAVLLERESLCGNPPPGREAGSRVAGTLAARPSGGGGLGTEFETDGGLIDPVQCGAGRPDVATAGTALTNKATSAEEVTHVG
jgi:hypothetical protein